MDESKNRRQNPPCILKLDVERVSFHFLWLSQTQERIKYYNKHRFIVSYLENENG